MPKRLEEYLTELMDRLDALPTRRRDEELQEMRQHLQNAVSANQEQGRSEEEATETILTQFGTAEATAEGVIEAWKRGETIRRREFWGSIASTPTILGGLTYLLCGTHFIEFIWPRFNSFFVHHHALGLASVHGFFFLIYGLTGVAVGTALPRQAVRGVCLGLIVFCVISSGGVIRPFPTTLRQFLVIAEVLAWASTALVSAWASSQWRRRHGQWACVS